MDTDPVIAKADTRQQEFGARERQIDRGFPIPKNLLKWSQDPDSTSVFFNSTEKVLARDFSQIPNR
jgi:hypothetical protein